MCCQNRTDSPKDAPSDSTTVPTMTPAATTLRVMSSMMMKISVGAATPAIIRSYSLPSCMPLHHDRYLAQPGVETRAVATPGHSFIELSGHQPVTRSHEPDALVGRVPLPRSRDGGHGCAASPRFRCRG